MNNYPEDFCSVKNFNDRETQMKKVRKMLYMQIKKDFQSSKKISRIEIPKVLCSRSHRMLIEELVYRFVTVERWSAEKRCYEPFDHGQFSLSIAYRVYF